MAALRALLSQSVPLRVLACGRPLHTTVTSLQRPTPRVQAAWFGGGNKATPSASDNSSTSHPQRSGGGAGGDDDDDKLPDGMAARLKHMQHKYGRTALVVFLGLDGVSLATCYALVRSGLDVKALLDAVHIDPSSWGFGEHGSTFIIAYAVHKVFWPARIAGTVAITPPLAKWLKKRYPTHF